MKKKQLLLGLVLLIGILLVCLASANADGWTKDGDHLKFLQDGNVLTGTQTISGKLYYFTEEGFLKGNGTVQYADFDYYFVNSSNKLQYGWQTVNNNKYYFDPVTGKALRYSYGAYYDWSTDWYQVYHDKRSYGYYASWKINGDWYVFNEKGVLQINNWYDGYYGNREGKILTGYQKVEDSYYYFDKYGRSQSGFIEVNGAIHYFCNNWPNNSEARGWTKIDSYWYYFDESTGAMKTGTVNIKNVSYTLNSDGTLALSGKTVLYDSNDIIGIDAKGNLLYGWQTINGFTYYFSDGRAITSIASLRIDGEEESSYFSFDQEGKMQTNTLVKGKIYSWSNSESIYYFGADGKAITGWKVIDGATYYFEPAAYIGIKTISDENNKWYIYLFDQNGKMQTNLLYKAEDGRLYYFGSDGKAITGWKTIDGATYYFDPTARIGLQHISDEEREYWYLFDQNGKMQTNLLYKAEDGRLYYFGSDGKAITDWKTIDGSTYYFYFTAYIGSNYISDEDGEYRYLFDKEGKMQKNLLYIEENGEIYYFGDDGKAITGWKVIDDYAYYFASSAYRNSTYYFEKDGEEHACQFDEDGRLISVDGGPVTIRDGEVVFTSTNKIKAFVTRCYRIILNREPDIEGLNYWYDTLYSGANTAAQIIDLFVNSDEFRSKNLSYGDQVEILYQAMLDRGSDADGKTYWVSMLNTGNSLAVIINGFCDSIEFTGICAEYGITPGSVDGGSATPAPAPAPAPAVDMAKIRSFVTRNYRVILGREPDADGLNYWAQRLASGEATAAEIINGFVNSDEFKSKNLSYGDQVEVLYQVMLDRGSDAAGKAYWVSILNGGNPLGAIINGFCNSDEFKGICTEYGITPGSVDVGELKPAKEVRVVDTNKIKGYITRCYRVILGREPDQGGLDYWTGKMASGELEAAAIIDQFVNSIEFKGKQLSNREAVEVLYQAMLGRGSDEAGMTYWLAKLESGDPFAVIINGFCNSQEFRGICAEYGITPGSVAVASVRTHAVPEEQEISEAEATEPEQEAEPEIADERTEQAKAFVTHCYQSALLRDPGAEETDYYANQILSGQMTAKDVARAFAFSQEFQDKWTDSTAFVRVLYRLCLDREADADGLVYWTDKLANGETAAAVFNALTENKEFVQVCATYGVPAGVDTNAIRAQEEAAAAAEAEANEAPAAPASEFTNEEKIRTFVSRFYRDAMGREADEEGLNYYTERILNGEATPKDVAREIILSEEFRGRMPGNEDLVRILYRVYLGREADEEGLANWAGQLDSGVTLETILNGFAGSEEFATVVNGLR